MRQRRSFGPRGVTGQSRGSTMALALCLCALVVLPVLLSACAPARPAAVAHHASARASQARLAATAQSSASAPISVPGVLPAVASSFSAVRTTPAAPSLSAREALLLDPVTGQVYLASNAGDEMPMASTTKIMTALVAISFGTLDQRITVGADAAALSGTEASVAGLRAGESFTLRELLYALLLPSGDDAAVAIADGVVGSQERFVQLMNLEAALLGLGHTHYADVHGLDAPGHFTTASDLAALTAAALRSPIFAAIVATPVYKVAATAVHDAHTWQTTNLLISSERYPGVLGVKTGFTGGAGYCLVFAAARPYGHLLGVLLGEPDEQARFDDAAALLTWGFAQIRPAAGVAPS